MFDATTPTATALGRAAAAATSTTLATTASAAALPTVSLVRFATPAAALAAQLLLNLLVHRHLDGDPALQHHLDILFRHVEGDNLAWATGRVEHRADLGHDLFCLHIVVIFIRKTAEQAPAYARDFGRIQR